MAKQRQVHGHISQHLRQQKNYCFACGKDNPQGMHLNFYYDEARKRFLCRVRLPHRYQGPPGHAHGGIIATILDEAMGKVNKIRSVVALTSEMQVKYLRPVPLGKTLLVEARERRVRGRKHINIAEIRDRRGEVLARGRAVFIAIDAEKMFAKQLRNRGQR